MYQRVENLVIEGARLIFKNFSGEPSQYNRSGDRNFCVVLDDPKVIDRMVADGWNVKTRPPREEGDDPLYYIRVKVSFFDDGDNRNPKIMLISGKNRRYLDQDELICLDTMSIENVDLTIRPYRYDVNGKTGVSGYLKNMFVTQKLDPLEKRYAELYDEEDEDNPF